MQLWLSLLKRSKKELQAEIARFVGMKELDI
jgi:hypothetical protein